MINQKKIEIGDKVYTLTANRTIIKSLYEIAPSILKIGSNKADGTEEGSAMTTGIEIMANLDVLFYDMLKIAHKNITKEKSDEILDQLEEEYDNVQDELIKFAMTVFPQGDQKAKKPLKLV